MHVHEVFGDWLPRNEKVVLPLFVANGITGVRDMGGDLDVLKVWRAQIAAGRLLGPRMVIAGPMLDGPSPRFPSSAPVANAADGRRVVDELKARGVDFIKIQSLVPRDGYFAAAEEAKKLGFVSWAMCRMRCAPRRRPTPARRASSTLPGSSKGARPSRINSSRVRRAWVAMSVPMIPPRKGVDRADG